MQTEWQAVKDLSSPIWVCAVFPVLPVRKLRIITVSTFQFRVALLSLELYTLFYVYFYCESACG